MQDKNLNTGKYVITIISLLLLLLGVYFCLSGDYAMNSIPCKSTGEHAVIPGVYLIFLSVFLFSGYRYALYKRKKDNERY